jgi:hypothetical protein
MYQNKERRISSKEFWLSALDNYEPNRLQPRVLLEFSETNPQMLDRSQLPVFPKVR